MEQTAVTWMANELLYLDNEFDMKLIDKNEYQKKRKSIIDQAKQMEKEQIMDAWKNGDSEFDKPADTLSELYYNETFKSE